MFALLVCRESHREHYLTYKFTSPDSSCNTGSDLYNQDNYIHWQLQNTTVYTTSKRTSKENVDLLKPHWATDPFAQYTTPWNQRADLAVGLLPSHDPASSPLSRVFAREPKEHSKRWSKPPPPGSWRTEGPTPSDRRVEMLTGVSFTANLVEESSLSRFYMTLIEWEAETPSSGPKEKEK